MATRKAAEPAKTPTRATSSTTRPRRARDSRSRDIIVAAADRVVEREGLDRLTFQVIGQELAPTRPRSTGTSATRTSCSSP
ncbi:hypothetical protein ACU8V6_00445 [Vibrio alginolyticus]